MKRRDLENKLKDLGFWEVDGTKHGKWTNGKHTEMVPRHAEVNEMTAKAILKRALEAKLKKDKEG